MLSYEIFSGNDGCSGECDPNYWTNCPPDAGECNPHGVCGPDVNDCGPDHDTDCLPDCHPEE